MAKKMKKFKFYGVDNNFYKLDDTVWEAKEDPSDGYRSYLGSIEIKTKDEIDDLNFFPDPIAEIYIREVNDDHKNRKGFQFLDVVDNYEWLFVGTGNMDDYYPYFLFDYKPKAPNIAWEEFIKEN